MTVRLYGRDVGYGSLAVVTRGFKQVLEGAGLLEGFVALDRSGGSEEDDSPPGAQARDAVFTGNLNMVRMMLKRAQHRRHWVTVTPNSTHVPRELLAEVLTLASPRILSASTWGTTIIFDALKEMGCEHEPPEPDQPWLTFKYEGTDSTKRFEVHTVRHGVSGFAPVAEEIAKTRADFDRGEFRVVHFSTTDGERKGTLELVQAWSSLRRDLPERARLLLVLDHTARAALLERLLNKDMKLPEQVNLLPRGDMDPAMMSKLLCHMHVLASPSRGEGFGLSPLEARASGVPIVTTDVTGHSAGHCIGPGAHLIRRSYELAPIDDGPAAVAPIVHPADIAEALHYVYANWKAFSYTANYHAAGIAKEWSWDKQLAPLVGHLR